MTETTVSDSESFEAFFPETEEVDEGRRSLLHERYAHLGVGRMCGRLDEATLTPERTWSLTMEMEILDGLLGRTPRLSVPVAYRRTLKEWRRALVATYPADDHDAEVALLSAWKNVTRLLRRSSR